MADQCLVAVATKTLITASLSCAKLSITEDNNANKNAINTINLFLQDSIPHSNGFVSYQALQGQSISVFTLFLIFIFAGKCRIRWI